VIGRTTLLV